MNSSSSTFVRLIYIDREQVQMNPFSYSDIVATYGRVTE
jgi:hypothetical protein